MSGIPKNHPGHRDLPQPSLLPKKKHPPTPIAIGLRKPSTPGYSIAILNSRWRFFR